MDKVGVGFSEGNTLHFYLYIPLRRFSNTNFSQKKTLEKTGGNQE